MKQNLIVDKTYSFAIDIIKLRKHLVKDKREYDLSRQLLRSGTSIGANVEEGIGAYSRKDFIYKMSIAYKEARESSFWIRLLRDTGFIHSDKAHELLLRCDELQRILGSIVKSSKK